MVNLLQSGAPLLNLAKSIYCICIRLRLCLFPSGSTQEIRELAQNDSKLEEKIRKQRNKRKCDFEYYYKIECDTSETPDQENMLLSNSIQIDKFINK